MHKISIFRKTLYEWGGEKKIEKTFTTVKSLKTEKAVERSDLFEKSMLKKWLQLFLCLNLSVLQNNFALLSSRGLSFSTSSIWVVLLAWLGLENVVKWWVISKPKFQGAFHDVTAALQAWQLPHEQAPAGVPDTNRNLAQQPQGLVQPPASSWGQSHLAGLPSRQTRANPGRSRQACPTSTRQPSNPQPCQNEYIIIILSISVVEGLLCSNR